jgi:hypothetical protein
LELQNKKVSRGITYSQAIKIIKEKDIKWISKEQYYDICDTDNRLSKEPEKLFEQQFTNWVEYLSIPKIYYDLKTCKEKGIKIITNQGWLDPDEAAQQVAAATSGADVAAAQAAAGANHQRQTRPGGRCRRGGDGGVGVAHAGIKTRRPAAAPARFCP